MLVINDDLVVTPSSTMQLLRDACRWLGVCVIRTKAVRKINNQWDAELILGLTDGPLDFFGHKPAVRAKQKFIALKIDEEAEAVRDQVLSDGYSVSEALDAGDVAQQHSLAQVNAWENVGLDDVSDTDRQQVMFEQGGAVSPSMLKAPVTRSCCRQ